jgi:O-antigen ligase
MTGAVKQPFTLVINRIRRGEVADWCVVAIAVSLPWSTSLTAFLIVLWLIAVIPILDIASLRRELMAPVGGLPVLLWGLAVVGMLWADVEWHERFGGLRSYHKLLLIPLLLVQFRRSERPRWVILGFLGSALALLILSWLTPYPGFFGNPKADVGIPVKDYILQSGIFAICALGLLGQAVAWRTMRPQLALAAVIVAAFFIANIIYVATSLTTLVTIVILLLVFGFRQFGWKGMFTVAILGSALASLFWVSSPSVHDRVTRVVEEVRDYPASTAKTSAGLRLEFWKKSIEFVTTAPMIGHGTGTITTLFQRSAVGHTGLAAEVTGNPHNQILAVAIQLGFLGVIALISMWIVHLALFSERTLVGWYGLIIVVSNFVGSLFNSHLFDFGQGWLYVFGVGVLGGVILKQKQV